MVTASNVVIGLGDGRLAAISVATGHLVWESDTGPGALGDLALGDGVLLVSKGGANGGLIAYRHDASGHLLDEASPTELDLARLAGNFAAAFVVILGLVALGGFLLGRVRGRDEPEGART